MTDGPFMHNPEVPFVARIDGVDQESTNISRVIYQNEHWDTAAPLIFLNGLGGEEIEPGEFPYFPDYNFGGLFPGMNRSGWLTLMGDVPSS